MELSIIKYKAKLLGKSVRAYVRDLAVTSEAKPSMTPEQIAVARDLDGVANNLNQLARWANTYHEYDPIKIQVERILNKIESIEDQLLL